VAKARSSNVKANAALGGRSADRVYKSLKAMAVTYQLRPGERLKEIELAQQLDVSRTPVREALNRLVTEGFLTSAPNKGFYCRSLNPKEIYDLYEYRCAIEIGIGRAACERATAEELRALAQFACDSRDEPGDVRALKFVGLDEQFHERLALLTHNDEYLRGLRNINSRIHFVRWIDMQTKRRQHTQSEHMQIVDALCARDSDRCADLLRRHIARRLDQVVDVIKAGFGEIYTRQSPHINGEGASV
jgi:DNA-binding GntR family transcriptional regulator